MTLGLLLLLGILAVVLGGVGVLLALYALGECGEALRIARHLAEEGVLCVPGPEGPRGPQGYPGPTGATGSCACSPE